MPQIKVGDYLFQRLHQLGIRTVFGVPGDYELALLDLVGDNNINFRGNPNELVGAYSADGYARLNGYGALITTFGPGETSAYCGIGGSYTEYVPIVNIVGYPPLRAVKSKAIMHHSLGDGRFDMFETMAKQIHVATTVLLENTSTAASEIDRVLTAMIHESRPVYIGISADFAYALVDDEGLKTALPGLVEPDTAVTEKVAGEIRGFIEKAEKPIIIVDGVVVRNNAIDEANEIITTTGLPTFVTSMGKGGVNEDLPNYGGAYAGGGTFPEIKDVVESADAILWLGSYPSDFNTSEFTMKVDRSKIVDIQRFFTTIGGKKVDVLLKYLLPALIKKLKATPLKVAKREVTWKPYPLLNPSPSGPLTQDFLWGTLGNFFRPGDVIVGETGTSAFGLTNSKLPAGAFMYNQTIWGSIGYATPASAGSMVAIKEKSGLFGGRYKRGILVTGEGSLQLTVQSFADMLRLGLNPVIFVLNNGGYTVERLIHGMNADYNTVAVWDYSSLAQSFGPGIPSKYFGPIKTDQELYDLLESPELNDNESFRLVEVILDKHDAPTSVKLTGAAIDEFNKLKSDD